MSDLISWLRATITGDEASPGPWVNTGQDGCGDAWQVHGAFIDGESGIFDWNDGDPIEVPVRHRVATLNYDDGGGVWKREAADHMVLQQPRDTIARCTSELAELRILEAMPKHAFVDRMIRIKACGYRHRPDFDPLLVLDPAELAELLAGAEERRKLPAQPDDLDALRARIDALKAERDPFRRCLECGHVYPTAADLLAEHAALVATINRETSPDNPPMVALTDPEKIHACPACAHDF